MGTRHHQRVINKVGERKLAQYGQWDGYPSGQGVDILRYLREADLEKYQANLDNLKKATEEDLEVVNKTENWQEAYPYLSRDCGSNIHQMIEDGEVKFITLCSDEEANQWCEGFYTIDFETGTFHSEFHGASKTYRLDDLPSDEVYLKALKDSDEEE
tara:strand:+ start:5716 stop:6186 length:471 start_codon:yes stop_codon:yes gene_type:complete